MCQSYAPDWNSLKTHKAPEWFNNSKFGIFIQWGLYSVPGFASKKYPFQSIPFEEEWFRHHAFSEYYLNTLRIGNNPTSEYHAERYEKDFPYERFTEYFTCEKWDPMQWAELFRSCGARYVVLTAKHHEGFCMWNSRYTAFHSVNSAAGRDIVKELSNAVKSCGMHMGLHYSGDWDWQFTSSPITTMKNCSGWSDFGVQTYHYADYAYHQLMELIDGYHPDILWCDNGWPMLGQDQLKYALSHFYNTNPDGVINDRWNNDVFDYSIREIAMGSVSLTKKWEQTRCIGLSYGYNQLETEEDALSRHDFVRLLVETVAHNGNLMVNLGPRADGTIPEIQLDRIIAIGEWLKVNGDAIFDTEICPEQQKGKSEEGHDLFFTRKRGKRFLIIDGLQEGYNHITVKGLDLKENTIRVIGTFRCVLQKIDNGFELDLEDFKENSYLLTLVIE